MDMGLVLPHTGPLASPSFIRDFAQAAEGHGFSRLWAVDHLVLPRHVTSLYVLGRQPSPVADGWLSDNLAPNYEMMTTLAWVAGQTRPQPTQRPVPILVGGRSETALDRAVRIADGWIAAAMSPGRLGDLISTLRRLADAHGRSSATLYKVASTTYCDARSFAESYGVHLRLGVDHLQVLLPGDEPRRIIDRFSEVAAVAGE